MKVSKASLSPPPNLLNLDFFLSLTPAVPYFLSSSLLLSLSPSLCLSLSPSLHVSFSVSLPRSVSVCLSLPSSLLISLYLLPLMQNKAKSIKLLPKCMVYSYIFSTTMLPPILIRLSVCLVIVETI